MCRFGAKRRRVHPKGGLDPLGSSEHHKMEAPPPPGGGGSELPKAASKHEKEASAFYAVHRIVDKFTHSLCTKP